MGKLKKFLLMGVFLLASTRMLLAVTDSTTFTVSATVPNPTSVSITAASVNATTNVFTTLTGTTLSFDPLTFDSVNSIYIPDHYFAINVGPAGGSGSTSVTLTYTEGNNPNNVTGGSGQGLGWKSVATFTKQLGGTETRLSSHGTNGKKLLKDISGESVTTAELGAGTFRLYLGIETNPAATGEPPGAQVFSNADRPGSYTGSLVVTGTVV